MTLSRIAVNCRRPPPRWFFSPAPEEQGVAHPRALVSDPSAGPTADPCTRQRAVLRPSIASSGLRSDELRGGARILVAQRLERSRGCRRVASQPSRHAIAPAPTPAARGGIAARRTPDPHPRGPAAEPFLERSAANRNVKPAFPSNPRRQHPCLTRSPVGWARNLRAPSPHQPAVACRIQPEFLRRHSLPWASLRASAGWSRGRGRSR